MPHASPLHTRMITPLMGERSLLKRFSTGLQLVFEDMGFRSYASVPAPALAVRQWSASATGKAGATSAAQAVAGVVLDAGFSFTHAAPVFDGRVLPSGVRRINLGGKALTNYMKELVSYRRGSACAPILSQACASETCVSDEMPPACGPSRFDRAHGSARKNART